MIQFERNTLSDDDVFVKPQHERPATFTVRNTVKAIVRNDAGEIGLVTNDIHKLLLLPGGGAESDNLEEEVRRECREELRCDVQGVLILGSITEYRYRNAEEYHTTCFVAEAQASLDIIDGRTVDEKKHNLHPIWLPLNEVHAFLQEQRKYVQNGKISYYNTAFSAVRDALFFEAFLERYK